MRTLHRFISPAVMLIAALAGRGVLFGAQVSIPSSADTTLFEGFSGNNAGADSTLAAGGTPNFGAFRALLRFNIAASIPAGVTITSASLQVTVVKQPGAAEASTFALHRVRAAWAEGNKPGRIGNTASAGEVTWVSRVFPFTSWNFPGLGEDSDHAATISSTLNIDATGLHTFPNSGDMVADVQAWLDTPAANFGWLLRSQAEATDFTAKRFAAREDVANAPQLIIYYMPSLPLHIDPPTLSGDQFQFQFQARANKSYVVERRALADTGSWTVVTNIPLQTVAGAVLVTDTVGSENAFYRVVEL